jgi:GH24 family phage-related lysozyme (muramidase)
LNDELIKLYPRSAGNTCTRDEIGKYLGEDRTDIKNSMTKTAADNYMRTMLLPRLEGEFNRIMAGMPSYTQCQLDAIFCLMYNIGTVGLEKNSPKLMKALRENDIDNIIEEMNHGGESHMGRRNWERQLFKENQYPPYP